MAKCKVDLNNFFNFSIQWHFTVGWPTFYVWFRTKTRITTMGGSHRYQNFIETIKYFWWWGVWRSQSTEILLLCNYGFYSWREVSTAIRHLVYSTYFNHFFGVMHYILSPRQSIFQYFFTGLVKYWAPDIVFSNTLQMMKFLSMSSVGYWKILHT